MTDKTTVESGQGASGAGGEGARAVISAGEGGAVNEAAMVAARAPSFGRHMRSTFLTGLLTIFPLFVTLYFLTLIYNVATSYSKPIAMWMVPGLVRLYASQPPASDGGATTAYNAVVASVTNWTSPIVALVISAAVVYMMGLLGTFVIGKRMLAAGEHFIENLPLIKGIYGTTKQVVGVFRQGGGGQGFQRVVMVEFPRNGIWTIGFVTNTIMDTGTGGAYLCVFIPMTPNPTSGFFQLFPVDEVRDTDWTVDQGIKIVLSGGLLAPHSLNFGKREGEKTVASSK